MLHEGTVRASRSLREELRQVGFKRASRLLREGLAEPPRCLSGESPSRRHRDVFATSSRRHHYGGFMNPSFEAFVDPPDGFHDTPGTPSNREGNFSPPEARMAGEPRMQLFAPPARAEKADFWFWAPKNGGFSERLKKTKNAEKYFLRVEKVIWPPNTITRRRRQKKKAEVFPLGRRKILLLRRPPKKPIFGSGRRKKKNAEKKVWGPKKKFEGRIFFGGGRKSYLAAEHHNEAAPKKKKKKNPLGRRKIRL